MAKAVKSVKKINSVTAAKVKKSVKTASNAPTKRVKSVEVVALPKVIGQAIAKYRKQAELSQEQLAEALGIGYEAVSRMERGIVVPSVERLIQIAAVVNCPVTELLTLSSPRPCDEVVRLHQLLSSLSCENKQWLMEQVELWVQKLK